MLIYFTKTYFLLTINIPDLPCLHFFYICLHDRTELRVHRHSTQWWSVGVGTQWGLALHISGVVGAGRCEILLASPARSRAVSWCLQSMTVQTARPISCSSFLPLTCSTASRIWGPTPEGTSQQAAPAGPLTDWPAPPPGSPAHGPTRSGGAPGSPGDLSLTVRDDEAPQCPREHLLQYLHEGLCWQIESILQIQVTW